LKGSLGDPLRITHWEDLAPQRCNAIDVSMTASALAACAPLWVTDEGDFQDKNGPTAGFTFGPLFLIFMIPLDFSILIFRLSVLRKRSANFIFF